MLTNTHKTCRMKLHTNCEHYERRAILLEKLNAEVIGQRLTQLRGSRTQEEVANALNISVSAISMYERGQRIPRDSVKIRIADYYKKPIHKIFYV